MNVKQKLKDKLAEEKKRKQELHEDIKQYVQDKSLSLDERWKFFIESKTGEEDAYLVHFDTLQKGKFTSWCRNPLEDDFYDGQTRGYEIDMEMMSEYLCELVGKEYEITATYEDHEKNITNKVTFTQEDLVKWKEEVLEKFIWSYRFDW